MAERGMIGPGAPPRRLAFFAPMPPELRPLTRRLALDAAGTGADAVQRGRIGSTPPLEVVATTTGIGPGRATERAERLLDRENVDHVIVVGVAGGFGDAAPVGSVVVPSIVVNGATGAELHATPLGGSQPDGRLITTKEFITDQVRLTELRDAGFVAVDMESAAIAAVCAARGLPWSVFRGISDDAFDPTVDQAVFALTRPDGSPDLAAVARFVLGRPSRATLLARLARDLKRATTGAVDAAVLACEQAGAKG